jgi:phosphoribosyl 1,2-cyclic phosphodiesterase
MPTISPLFSGSSGNCTYIGDNFGGILVDAGGNAKRICAGLDAIGVDPARIGAIFVTHEHNDHIAGLRVFTKRFGTPVLATAGTLEGLQKVGAVDRVAPEALVVPPQGAEVNGMLVESFKTSHDCLEGCGYKISFADGQICSVATDTGRVTSETLGALLESDVVMLESNHEENMLLSGPYPYFLKRRILSGEGHLSNADCANTLATLIMHRTRRFILAHLSQENNDPRIAHICAANALTRTGAIPNEDFTLCVAGDTPRVLAF